MGILDRLFGGKTKSAKPDPEAMAMDAAMRAHAEDTFRQWGEWAKKDTGRKKDKVDVSKLRKEKDVDGLARLIHDEDEKTQSAAASALGDLGDARGVEPLIGALSAGSPDVRLTAAYSLGRLGDPRALEPLARTMSDEDYGVQRSAAIALGRLGQLQHLEGLLGVGNQRERILIADELISVGGLKAVPILTRALNDPLKYHAAALAIAHSVGRLRDSGHVDSKTFQEAMIPAIQHFTRIVDGARISSGVDTFSESVALAVTALGEVGDLQALDTLGRLLVRVNEKVRAEGVVRQYVDNGIAAGYVSNESSVSHVTRAMESIRKRHKA